jgi:hypothetical protein
MESNRDGGDLKDKGSDNQELTENGNGFLKESLYEAL